MSSPQRLWEPPVTGSLFNFSRPPPDVPGDGLLVQTSSGHFKSYARSNPVMH